MLRYYYKGKSKEKSPQKRLFMPFFRAEECLRTFEKLHEEPNIPVYADEGGILREQEEKMDVISKQLHTSILASFRNIEKCEEDLSEAYTEIERLKTLLKQTQKALSAKIEEKNRLKKDLKAAQHEYEKETDKASKFFVRALPRTLMQEKSFKVKEKGEEEQEESKDTSKVAPPSYSASSV